MSDKALNNIYGEMILNEAHYGQRQEFPKRASGQTGAVEAGRGLSYQNNKFGLTPPNMAVASGAGSAQFGNPTEQEEGELVSKSAVIRMIDTFLDGLDSGVPTERVAVMTLASIKKLINEKL